VEDLLRKRRDSLQTELKAARQSLMDLKSQQQQETAENAQEQVTNLSQEIESLNAKLEESQSTIVKMRALAKKYKEAFEGSSKALNVVKEQLAKAEAEKAAALGIGQPTTSTEEQPAVVEKMDEE
jgi:chromosome segregation ATPase